MFHCNKITLEVSSQVLLSNETTQLLCECWGEQNVHISNIQDTRVGNENK